MDLIFDLTTTDMSYYDKILRGEFKTRRDGSKVCFEIKYISPDAYISECARVHNSTIENQYLMISEAHINYLIDEFKNKEFKFPLILIDEYDKTQEGRHRALVAKKLNINTIPVLYIS